MKNLRLYHDYSFTFFLLCLVFLPCLALAKCGDDSEDGTHNKNLALKYKIGALFSILLASTVGVCIPILGRTFPALQPEKDIFFIIKAFAAGVILSTGFIHVLPDAFEKLTDPCLGKNPSDFPFTGFVAMLTAMLTLMIDAFATLYFRKSHFDDKDQGEAVDEAGHESHLHVHTHATHGHAHGSAPTGSTDILRHRVISQELELGIVVHSVIIGISLGASEDPKEIKPVIAALTFHQFFEGIGLGGCIRQAKFKRRAVIIMSLFFSLTTPMGIAIGIGITTRYDENSSTALIVEGILNAASAGILIYMSLVDLLAVDFMNPRMQNNGTLQIQANVSLLLGAGCMSVIAKWA